ncbi:Two-component sensor PilS [Dissulfuribacter thermophilus]|uniref:histidine kinase n=1 Tax=Dissulfuribacter thermophilus TaxID=1156395 RepID=A0A1B9F2Y7_9BACT|nr:Two-component sensor PilS [Dissulfuribacter thermophilus]
MEEDGTVTVDIDNFLTDRSIPLWKANIIVFSCLFIMVLVLFFLQVEQTRRAFLQDQMAHAQILSNVFKLHVRNAVESQKITDQIVKTHLRNIASFIDYLDSFEPFSPQELELFARRTGLYGIAIIRPNGKIVTSVREWLEKFPYTCNSKESFSRDHDAHLLILSKKGRYSEGCIVCALPSTDFERLQAQIGLSSVMKALRDVKGVISIEIDRVGASVNGTGLQSPEIEIQGKTNSPYVTMSIPVENKVLKVILDASRYRDSMNRLWRNFFLISLFILLGGAILSYWLYKKQRQEMRRAVLIEKAMSRQREDAMIGRAAATIAHEVRNPLNAVHMGLQRLLLESDSLDESEKRLLKLSLTSIRQANSIISNLLEFSRPISPKVKDVILDKLLEEVIYVLGPEQRGIEVKFTYNRRPVKISIDPELMRQVFLNLVKNAIEAQSNGGYLDIIVEDMPQRVIIRMRNGGIMPKENQVERLLEPYFTTKIKGTGIGLPYSKRIVSAHGGQMDVQLKDGAFEVEITIPKVGGIQS